MFRKDRLLGIGLAFSLVSSCIGAAPIVDYKKKTYIPIGMDGRNLIIEYKGKPLTLKKYNLRLKKDRGVSANGVAIEIEGCSVSLVARKEKELLLNATIKASEGLKDCFAVLVSESGRKSALVAHEIKDLKANESVEVGFRVEADEFTEGEPYRLYFFSGSERIAMDGDQHYASKITPYLTYPRALFQVAPKFPKELMDRYSEARVRIEFVIEADGSVSGFEVLESPDEAFSKEAILSLERSKFSPRRVEGKAVPTKLRQWITFRLKKEPEEKPGE